MTGRILYGLVGGVAFTLCGLLNGTVRAADAPADAAKVRAAELEAAKAGVKAAEVAVTAAREKLRTLEQLAQGKLALESEQSVLTAKVAAANADRDLAVARLALARAEQSAPQPNAKVKALQKERLKSLQAVTDAARKAFEAGRGTLDEVRRSALDQLQAEFESCGSQAERVDVLTQMLKEARGLEQQTAERVKQAAAPEVELRRAEALRLTVEIALERERPGGDSKPAENPTWRGTIRVEGDKTKAELAALTKVTLAEAEKAALAGIPGDAAKTAVEVELEVEHGFLVFEVGVVVPGKAGGWSVVVDAGTGKVLAVQADPAEDGTKRAK